MKKSVIALVLVVLFSCNEKLIEKPENLIAQETMTNILYDLAIINAAKSSSVKILQQNNIETMDYIYKKYNIDSVQFVRSDSYYASIPATYFDIYNAVESRLDNEKTVWDAKKKEEVDEVQKKNQEARNKLRKADEKKPN